MRICKSVILSVVAIIFHVEIAAQSISSVYSNNGIGIPNYQGLPHDMAMGEVGIGVPNAWNLNYLNPAFLAFNNTTMLQVGIEMDRRTILSNTLEGKKVAGGLRYFNLGFPVMIGKWTSAIGLTPFSTVNNKTFSYTFPTATDTAKTVYTGIGGLSSLHWSNGFKLGKNLFAGVRTTYTFGSIEDVELSSVFGTSSYAVEFTDRSTYKGLKVDLAAGYRINLTDERILNLGVVYEFADKLNGRHDQWEEGAGIDRRVIASDEPFLFKLPNSISFGVSYQVLNKLTLASDIVRTGWSEAGNVDDDFANTVKVGVGVQYTPNYASINRYLERVTYRAGFNFGSLPYVVNGQRINEVGITFGGSFPVGLSNLDLAMKYGQQGTLDNDLIRETYFRIVLGATISDRWFIKRRYD